MNKKRELEISLSAFRRRPLHYLDRAYETKEPILIFRHKQLVGIVWKSYGPKKVKSKLKYWSAVLGVLEVHMAGKGYDLRAQLGLAPAVEDMGKSTSHVKQARQSRKTKKRS